MTNYTQLPTMTHPLSHAWEQPKQDQILIDDQVAVMDEKTLKQLHEYSMSTPTGVYEGKMWRSFFNGEWYLNWWDISDEPDKCSHKRRLILIIE